MNPRAINKKILFFTLGKENLASSRVRVYQYLPYLKDAGFDYFFISYTSAWYHQIFIRGKSNYLMKVLNKIYSWVSVLHLIFKARNFDIILIQRILLSKAIFKILHRLNSNIIFDFDDAIYLADKYCKFKLRGNRFLARFNYIVKNSKYIITTQSEFNQSFVRSLNKNIITLPTPVDVKKYLPRKENKKNLELVIGWIGSPDTTYYLHNLKDVFCMISKKYPKLKIELIGAKRFQVDGANLVFKDWDLETEKENLRNFDIGIMPLEDDAWSRNKYYKLLQYFALGIPAVVSSVGLCKDTIKDGVNGFVVKDKDGWIDKLSLLIEDPDLRQRLGRCARKTAEDSYSYEVTSPILIKLFRDM